MPGNAIGLHDTLTHCCFVQKKWTALHMAAGNNDLVVANMLLDSAANSSIELALTVDGDSALDWASDIGHAQMISLLSSRGVVRGDCNR